MTIRLLTDYHLDGWDCVCVRRCPAWVGDPCRCGCTSCTTVPARTVAVVDVDEERL